MAINRGRVGYTAPKKSVFVRKTGGFDVYKWSPLPANFVKNKQDVGTNRYYCTATANSQGYDFITTYDYNVIFVDGMSMKLAYVACDYVS